MLGRLDGVTEQGGEWVARCPAHEDRNPSLTIARGTKQPVVMWCHAGCDIRDVLATIGLSWAAVCAPRDGAGPVVVAEYRYTDESGEVLYVKERREPKDFRLKRPDGGGWRWNLGGVRRVLYRLPEVAEAIAAGREVWGAPGSTGTKEEM